MSEEARIVTITRRYKIVEHTCPVCQSVFTGTKKKTYCSEPCRRKAAWSRNGGKVNARRKIERRQKQEEKS
ncbi:MAG TPA: hypothetical protein VKT32_01655 [Chthonomonadaceae bacterium]|nr:hypothetical protein [Chthonomonadaceae bacterium]